MLKEQSNKSRYMIHLAYNGSSFHGWQVQPNAKTVQEELNKGLSLLLSEDISVVGAGRTDTGVHARNFYAHFDSLKNDIDFNTMIYRLNMFLGKDVVIYGMKATSSDFNARFDAKSRTYKYYISGQKDPFNYFFEYYYPRDLDVELMNQGCEIIMSYDDFESFSKVHTDVKTFVCDIRKAIWVQNGAKLEFTITADRFLRNMVRAIVGTLIDLGRRKISKDELHQIIKQKNRSAAGTSVPPHALFLEDIEY